jgi:6-pyruvoyltetrahydropterin/6-carboxytetrahydropterin synthase
LRSPIGELTVTGELSSFFGGYMPPMNILKPLPVRCIRSFSIDAGHRVYGHESKCANLHGHTYTISVHAEAQELDKVGRVIDFSVLKDKIGTWLLDNWDHGFLYYDQDKEVEKIFLNNIGWKSCCLPCNPTAENMASYLLWEICPELMQDTGVRIVKVEVRETPNCYAVAELEITGPDTV